MPGLALSASIVVLVGLCWLLSLLTRSALDSAPTTGRHVAIAAGLCGAAAGLIAYMTGSGAHPGPSNGAALPLLTRGRRSEAY